MLRNGVTRNDDVGRGHRGRFPPLADATAVNYASLARAFSPYRGKDT